MAGPFHSLSIAASGMDVYQTWLDAVADNVANINTIRSTDQVAFQERFVVAAAVEENGRPGGATVTRAEFGNPDGLIYYDPLHPLADDEGMVRAPDINLSDQMTHLLAAQRAYQANVAAFERARDAYVRALEIGS
ncbi:MAG: flagellar basal-body rod protein FlgC [Acidimicrobiia bacterium]|nr:flagellar basal-body rod protein FlgC [Acidimicrobiia bacterium]